ncbi:MAG TPA: type I glutamate--ammonia ligase [Myxococcota bacterium]|nr:type I glutamate--ammonia ligase [Myxococcota bacterium]
MFSTIRELVAYVRKEGVTTVDFKFTALMGKAHHVTLPARKMDESIWESGIGFDGSNMPGFKTVEAGDMVIVPDITTAFIDPFFSEKTLSLICGVFEAGSLDPFPRDPRGILKHACDYMASTGIADDCRFGPEFEFYLLDEVATRTGCAEMSHKLVCREGQVSAADGARERITIAPHRGYHACPPADAFFNIRNEMAVLLEQAGVGVNYHHHEVGATGQQEIEVDLAGPMRSGDVAFLVKYFVKMTARKHGMVATFMPKPFFGEAGSGMHFHQHLFKGGQPVFFDKDGYAGLSKTALAYVAGLLHHAPSILAITNPTTNSYRRLVPGYEAPVNAFFSLGNRSAAIRIPKYASRPDKKRIEFRSPDGTCNPYLAMAVMLMAGLDGVRKNMDPTVMGFGPYDMNVFAMSPEERAAKIKPLPSSLPEALDALESDHAFLEEGGVFSKSLISDWISIHRKAEVEEMRSRPHPWEIETHLDC